MANYQPALPLLKALCDETRLSIISMLAEGEMCACRIQDAFQCTQPTISYHMRVLVDAGLVTPRKEGCLTCYSVVPGVVPAVEALLAAFDGIAGGGERNIS